MTTAILLAAALAAQVPGPPMSLGDAWRAAQGRDPDILAAEAKRRADREAATQARALSLPKVQAQGDVTVTRTEVDVNLPPDLAPSFGGTQTGGRATTSVQAAMPIYDLGNRADATKLRARRGGRGAVRRRGAGADPARRPGLFRRGRGRGDGGQLCGAVRRL